MGIESSIFAAWRFSNEREEWAGKKPEFIVRDGQPVAVILDIGHYQELLQRLEDVEGLRILEAIRKKPLRFRKPEDFLEYSGRV